jgi:hypothetical protein
MYKNKNKKPKGFIAIASLLIISAVIMTFAMLMLKDGVENASLSLHSIYYDNARINVNVCLEDVLMRIKKEEQFTRNLNYTISDNDYCSVTMEWFAPQQINPFIIERLVDVKITGASHNFTRTFNYALKIAQHKLYKTDSPLEYLNNINIISINEITT